MKISDIVIEHSQFGFKQILIKQDDDVIIVRYNELIEFADIIRKYIQHSDKWYIVLKDSNYRLTNTPTHTIIFTNYNEAEKYAKHASGKERIYLPISVDHYKKVFGKLNDTKTSK